MKFRSTFDECFDAMNRYCLRRLPIDEVNDAVAEVFAVAWRKVNQMPDGEEALPWLCGVARYEVSNRRRTARRSLALKQKLKGLAHHAHPGPEPEIVRATELQHLLEALRSLKPSDKNYSSYVRRRSSVIPRLLLRLTAVPKQCVNAFPER
jgi:RNA polymerase sigma-70 factor (ECF subfamily)